MEELLTLQELAKYLKMAEKTVYAYALKGIVPGIRVGSVWRFRKKDVDEWLEKEKKLTEESTSSKKKREKKIPK